MTPKQKALQLVDAFTCIDEFTINGSKIYYHDSVKCALITVDAIINALPPFDYGLEFVAKIQYWLDVKTEILAL